MSHFGFSGVAGAINGVSLTSSTVGGLAVGVFSVAFYDVIKCGLVYDAAATMPRIIRRALYQKLRELPELREFQKDFELLSGMSLAFVDELGLGDDFVTSRSPMCEVLQSSAEGRAMCARMRHSLLSGASEQPACATCDAGLSEVVVPLKIGGICAGFFVFGGTCRQAPDPPAILRVRHLLRKHGVEIAGEDLESHLGAARVLPEANLMAYQRVVHLAARQIALKVTDQLASPEASIPPAVRKACGFIRARAVVDDLNLAAVARHCGVSEGHLSRLFHHSTGLTFREYVAQVRLEHARALLIHTAKGVTEIAFESGFQSVSQFHRVFRKTFGATPGAVRSKRDGW